MNNKNTRSATLFGGKNYEIECGPVIFGYQLKSPENMGHMIRLAANFNCQRVLFVGDKEQVRESKIKKVAGAAFEIVNWSFVGEEDWMGVLGDEYKYVAIETALNSIDITKFDMPDNVAFVFGNEIHGLADDIVQQCDAAVHIPMTGRIKSMNVSQSCVVALYEWTRQQMVVKSL